jgi:hypothetical protein
MEEWKEMILEAIRNGDTLSAHQYAAKAINNPENKLMQGSLCSHKKYNSYLSVKGNKEYFIINESTHYRVVLHNGDIVTTKFGNLYVTGVIEITDDHAQILPAFTNSESFPLDGVIPRTAILLLSVTDYLSD